MFIVFSNKKLQLNYIPILIVLPLAVVLHLFSCNKIINRFYKESYYEKTEFYCNVEEKIDSNYFKTTNKNVVLQNAVAQSTNEHKSGKYSLLLSPQYPFGFTYSFNNLSQGDLVEMEVWKKGNAGELVLSGKAPNCVDFYASKKQSIVVNTDGWAKIHYVFTIGSACTNYQAALYVWNPGKENVYFDDLKFSIKKFKPYNLY
jgi:hypothetical protein